MRNLRMKHDAFIKKEYDEKMAQLQQNFAEIEKDMQNISTQEIDQMMGIVKEKRRGESYQENNG